MYSDSAKEAIVNLAIYYAMLARHYADMGEMILRSVSPDLPEYEDRQHHRWRGLN